MRQIDGSQPPMRMRRRAWIVLGDPRNATLKQVGKIARNRAAPWLASPSHDLDDLQMGQNDAYTMIRFPASSNLVPRVVLEQFIDILKGFEASLDGNLNFRC